MDKMSNDSNALDKTITPIVAYEFPCSYLGKPRPIQSSLSPSLLGALLPPIGPHWERSNSTNNTTTTTPQLMSSDIDHTSASLSCPRRTIDGISSRTILESEIGVGILQSHNSIQLVGSRSNPHSNIDNQPRTLSNALAVEVWFTPLLLEEKEEVTTDQRERPLLPIVSIAEPLSSVLGQAQSATGNDHSDPCTKTQLTIGQRGEFLELIYRDYYEYIPDSYFWLYDDDDDPVHHQTYNPQYSCRILRLTQWKLREETIDADGEDKAEALKGLRHLVVAWKKSGSVLQIFGDGKAIVSIDLLSGDESIEVNTNSNFLRHWDPTYRLQVFSESPWWNEARGLSDFTKSIPTGTGLNTTENRALFLGTIHEVAIYKQDIDADTAKTSYKVGVEKRKDPFRSFFKDPNKPFEPLRLVALPTFLRREEDESDKDMPIRGMPVTQGSSTLVSVGASKISNSTTALWDVLVEILQLPMYGELVYYDETKESRDTEYSVAARVGDRLLLEEGSLRTNIEYRQLEEEYFSIPLHSYNGSVLPMADLPGESFSYRLIAVKKTKEGNIRDSEPSSFFLGVSEAVQQELTIVHKNHPPILEGLPREVVQPKWQPSGVGARPWATLGTNVVLKDEKDHDIDRVRLYFWAEKGTLTIDLEDIEIRKAAEITDCSNPTPTRFGGKWICTGKNDRNMTLLATPTDISTILSNVKYNAFYWNTSDSIVLRIYDGGGALCPGGTGYNNTKIIYGECYSIDAVVEVPPMPRTEGGPSRGDIWRDHRAWWISLVVFLAILSTSCCCAIGCWRRLRRIKKLNDIAVSDLERPSVVLASPEEGFPSHLGITEEDKRRAAIGLNRKKDDSTA